MNNQSTKDKDAISTNGMAATSHPLATEEAIRILKKGGNAVDASIAASIVLSVVEPNATSIGGDCFAIVKMEGKESVSYNGCLLYTSPSPRDLSTSRMPSSA